VQKSLEIARLEAQINKNHDAYQKLPRRKFVGARTQEYRFAQYIEDWRVKVERLGNLNYPNSTAREDLWNAQLSVSIKADGSVEAIEVSRSSGHRILDAAAMRIVKLAAPYAPLPPDITKDVDILTITRTWTFTHRTDSKANNHMTDKYAVIGTPSRTASRRRYTQCSPSKPARTSAMKRFPCR